MQPSLILMMQITQVSSARITVQYKWEGIAVPPFSWNTSEPIDQIALAIVTLTQ